MKKLYAFAVMLLLAFGANAQSWNFIKANERYHFQHKDDNLPLNTIFADSASLVGTDSILSLNRLLLACDTCGLYFDGTDSVVPYYDNQPSFLQCELVYSQVSSTVVLHNPEENIIKLPNLGIKEWWFNQAKNQKAVLDTIEYADVLGVKDSVATILINGEAQIKIAKQLGLIQYFDYTLSGLEVADLGNTLPTWKDFYDFEVGDVFMYYNKVYQFGAAPPTGYTFSKYTVTNFDRKKDTIVIAWNRVGIASRYVKFEGDSEGNEDFTSFKFIEGDLINETGSWVITENNISNTYPDEFLMIMEHEFVDLVRPKYQVVNESIVLNIGSENSIEETEHFMFSKDSSYFIKGSWDNAYDEKSFISYKYEIGKGRTSLAVDNFSYDWNEREEQIGYVKANDTTGFVADDSYFVITTINELQLTNIQISPNPSNGQINLDLGDIEQAQVVVYNLQGKEVEQFVAANTVQKDLSHLNNGVYLITIEANGAIKQLKWIKQ